MVTSYKYKYALYIPAFVPLEIDLTTLLKRV